MGLDIGMIYQPIRCINCEHVFEVTVNDWEVTCPRCSTEMAREGAHEYCKCTHQHKEHTRTHPTEEGCNLCDCLQFDSVKDYHPEEYDEFVKNCFCAHEFKKVSIADEELKYMCKNCGCIYQGLKPGFWQVEEESDYNGGINNHG